MTLAPSTYRNILGSFTALFAFTGTAHASFLDTDFFCRNFGCAVVSDGRNVDIYDNWIFASNRCCVAIGERMIPFSSLVSTPNLTGTLDTAAGTAPSESQSFQLGIAEDGVNISQSVIDNGDGYLDASDALSRFSLNSNTDIQLDGTGRQYSHSFFVTSRNTRFSLRARTSRVEASGDFRDTIGLEDIRLRSSIQTSGNDDGFRFGNLATASNITVINSVDDLGDLTGSSRQIIDFGRRRGIRQSNGDIGPQTLRLDFLYSMPDYDLSLGVGALDVDIVFDFHREP